MLERRGEMREQLRQLGKLGVASAHRGRAFALVAGEPVQYVYGVIGAALFAVIDDVDAAFDLLPHNMGHRIAHCGGELGLALAGGFLLGQQKFYHLGGARQAAGVGGENAICAAFHFLSLLRMIFSENRSHFGTKTAQDFGDVLDIRR